MPKHTATRALPGLEGYRRLARLVARLFYADECPPREEMSSQVEEDGTSPQLESPVQKKPPKHTFEGLGILIIDYLASNKVDGYVDELDIVKELRLGQKTIRKALRYLEGEHLVSSESVKFSLRRKNAEAPDDPDVEERRRQETHVFWCLDYPRMVDMIHLRLHRMKETLQRAIEGGEALQRYICSRCGANFSSLDAISLLDPSTGLFRCEHCQSTDLHEYVDGPAGSGGTASTTRRERQAFYKDLRKRIDEQLRPISDQLSKLRGTNPPDYGSLQDWYQGKKAEAARRAKRLEAARRRLAAGGAGAAEMTEDQLLEWAERAEVVVALPGGPEETAGARKSEEGPEKELPMWFRSEEETMVGSVSVTGAAGTSEDAHGTSNVGEYEEMLATVGSAAQREEERQRQQQYLEQYLLQVRASLVAGGTDQPTEQKEITKYGMKTESREILNVKEEEKEEPMEGIEWQDVEEVSIAKGGTAALNGPSPSVGNTQEEMAEENEWEDV